MKEELAFRKCKKTDAKQLAKVANNKNIARNMRDAFPHPYTMKDAEGMIARCTADNPHEHHFAITLNDGLIGRIGAFAEKDVYARNWEVGYWVAEEHWNKGYGTRALKWLVNFMFENTDAHRLFAGVFEYNVASRNVVEKAGFRLVARVRQKVFKDGAFYDEYLYDMLREDWEN